MNLKSLVRLKMYYRKDTTTITHKDSVVKLTPIFETEEDKKGFENVVV